MKRREFLAGLGGAAAWPVVARGQPAKMPVVGFVDMRSGARSSELHGFQKAFFEGLQEAGFIDHRNVIIDHREAADVDQVVALGADLARSNVAVLCAPVNAIVAAKAVSSIVPMVFIGATDPIGAGLVESFNRPGGNVTGVRLIAGDLPSKQIQVMHEFIPEATKFGLLMNPAFPNGEQEAAVAANATRSLGLTPVVERIMTESDFGPAFSRFRKEGVDAVLVITNIFVSSYSDRLVGLALEHHLPILGQTRAWSMAGALASYGADTLSVFRQAGTYVGRILKGEKPADLPVQQPTKFDFVINLKTANALGLTVPPSLLARADEVIE